jgi:sulfoxide reductase heme-binding subunit YedZ
MDGIADTRPRVWSPGADTLVRWLKPLVFLLCLVPLGLLAWRVADGRIGPNPIEAVLHFTGLWALYLLLITLGVTPLRVLTGAPWLTRFRRMLGLYAFFYAVLHFAVYLVLDRALMWDEIVTDIARRPYITVGFVALVLLIPLAVTSTKGWMRRLGRRWKPLHRAIYAIGILGVLHFLWLVKQDLGEPLLYAAILAVLLAFRLPWRRWIKPARPGAPRGPA